MTKKYRRRKYLINRSVQPRYMCMVALFICIISLITGWTVYSNTWYMITERIQGEPELAHILADLNQMLFTRIALVILAGVCVAVVITMFISHRVAGPIFRINKTLEELGEGTLPRKIKLRQRDEFKELSSAVNSVIEKAEEINRANRAAAESLKKFSGQAPGLEDELQKLKFFEEEEY